MGTRGFLVLKQVNHCIAVHKDGSHPLDRNCFTVVRVTCDAMDIGREVRALTLTELDNIQRAARDCPSIFHIDSLVSRRTLKQYLDKKTVLGDEARKFAVDHWHSNQIPFRLDAVEGDHDLRNSCQFYTDKNSTFGDFGSVESFARRANGDQFYEVPSRDDCWDYCYAWMFDLDTRQLYCQGVSDDELGFVEVPKGTKASDVWLYRTFPHTRP